MASTRVHPEYVLCPVTGSIFLEPVMILPSGHTLEKSAAVELIARAKNERKVPKCPITRQPIQNFQTNFLVISVVDQYLQEFPDAKEDQYKLTISTEAPASNSTNNDVSDQIQEDERIARQLSEQLNNLSFATNSNGLTDASRPYADLPEGFRILAGDLSHHLNTNRSGRTDDFLSTYSTHAEAFRRFNHNNLSDSERVRVDQLLPEWLLNNDLRHLSSQVSSHHETPTTQADRSRVYTHEDFERAQRIAAEILPDWLTVNNSRLFSHHSPDFDTVVNAGSAVSENVPTSEEPRVRERTTDQPQTVTQSSHQNQPSASDETRSSLTATECHERNQLLDEIQDLIYALKFEPEPKRYISREQPSVILESWQKINVAKGPKPFDMYEVLKAAKKALEEINPRRLARTKLNNTNYDVVQPLFGPERSINMNKGVHMKLAKKFRTIASQPGELVSDIILRTEAMLKKLCENHPDLEKSSVSRPGYY